jgi:hypothetical protein
VPWQDYLLTNGRYVMLNPRHIMNNWHYKISQGISIYIQIIYTVFHNNIYIIRYNSEMMDYVPPMKANGESQKKMKAKKDKNAPKGNIIIYFIYMY